MNYDNIKRAWIISDIHFGVHSDEEEWMEIQKDYFNNFFIPLLEKNKREGDALFILGDTFENRQHVNIMVMNIASEIIDKLRDMMPIAMLIGNHDCYKKSTTDTASPVMFKSKENIDVIDKMKKVYASGKSLLFVPWVEDKHEMQDILKSNKSDYLFVHDDFLGMKSNSSVTVPGGLPYTVVNQYGHVYSGHIHYGQKVKNVTMVGSPYHTTRSDTGNDKKVYLLDFESETEEEFINDYSPKYMTIGLEEAVDMGKELNEVTKNNFVKVIVNTVKTKTFDYNKFTEENMDSARLVKFEASSDETSDEEDIISATGKSIEELVDDYVDAKLDYPDKVKERLKEVAKKVLKKAQEI